MGRKIKWKDFEGEPEDIAKFLQMTNVDVKDFMPNPMNRRVINIILVVLIMVVFVLLLVHHFVNESGQSVISFISSFLLFIEIFFVHRRWNIPSLTVVAAIIAFFIFIVGVGISDPESALSKVINF